MFIILVYFFAKLLQVAQGCTDSKPNILFVFYLALIVGWQIDYSYQAKSLQLIFAESNSKK